MRLIDADVLEEDMCNLWMQNEISNGDWIGFRELLNSQETVVEFDGDINKVVVKGVEYFPQKTGKWIQAEDIPTEYAVCTNCKGHGEFYMDYCWHCGARMEREEE